MLQLAYSEPKHIIEIAICQMECFPTSFNTRLGKSFTAKSLSWFLQNNKRFLFHVTYENKIVGFCGGFAPQFYGDGSSSGMLQFAFKEAILGVLKKPWLIFNQELRVYYPFILRNIKKKLGIRKTVAATPKPSDYVFVPSIGLVVIGVHPAMRGKGVFELLMKEFENKALQMNIANCSLSVRSSNSRAIAAYKKMGWQIKSDKDGAIVMFKQL
ncbi:MAG: GNAT family N-acetyltransferase [Chitinophagaceae bacterium]|nr:GNAT family N-acetyltransferase [Chitinophagaceae bacterium]